MLDSLEVVWFSSVPVLEGDWFTAGHPEESSFFSLVSSGCPEMFVAETYAHKMQAVNV